MRDGLFRKTSLDKVSSPEEINNYVKTVNPSAWIIFISIALLLAGAVLWGFWGTVYVTLESVAVCEDGEITCYVSENDMEQLTDHAYVSINSESYFIEGLSQLPVPAADILSQYSMHLAGFDTDEWVYISSANGEITDGIYPAEIVIERISPISLLMN